MKFFSRKVLLFLSGIIFLILFFLLPMNREWAGTVSSYWTDFTRQKNDLNTETRLRLRFGTNYTYTKLIGDSISKKGMDRNLILLPPTSYFKKMGVGYHVPVSPVFYYYTGIKTVWADNPHAPEADGYVRVSNGKIIIEKVTDRKALQDTIVAFQKLGVKL
ncbi:MAG TPA: hypothetical protein VEB42_03985 [Chitinophagaceae bacterium]|nr:hypothetical protein [Chitinophagaceae bacterium]